jgi:fructose-1,6-bisphosphatase/inositol monophosphatase family enzyme
MIIFIFLGGVLSNLTSMEITNLTISAVIAAGEKVIDGFGKANIVKRKGVADFVTQIDCEIQSFLATKLKQILPFSEIVKEV